MPHKGWGWGDCVYKPNLIFPEMAHTNVFSFIPKTAYQPLICTKHNETKFKYVKNQFEIFQKLQCFILALLYICNFYIMLSIIVHFIYIYIYIYI